MVEAQTAPASGMTSVMVHEEPSPRDSIRLEESRSSSASSTCDWYPKNMKGTVISYFQDIFYYPIGEIHFLALDIYEKLFLTSEIIWSLHSIQIM